MNILPFANAPSIVRANQKDTYFETLLRNKISDLVTVFKNPRVASQYTEEIKTLSTLLYLALTTLAGSKTLGEEYVDLNYVRPSGRRMPKLRSRIGFVLSYTIIPYLIKKFLKLVSKDVEGQKIQGNDSYLVKMKKIVAKISFLNLIDLANLHLALFYFTGKYYQFSKRLFGLRYALGYDPRRKNQQQKDTNGGYEILGVLIFAQLILKNFSNIKGWISSSDSSTLTDGDKIQQSNDDCLIYGLNKKRAVTNDIGEGSIDLSDATKLTYIPEDSRNCMLCLSKMVDPACASCGHIFCWSCILDWCKERSECPLCRASLKEASLLPLR